MFVTGALSFPVKLQSLGFQNGAYAVSQCIIKAKYENGAHPKHRLRSILTKASILKCRMNIERHTYHQSFEDIAIYDTVNYSIYLFKAKPLLRQNRLSFRTSFFKVLPICLVLPEISNVLFIFAQNRP